MKWHQAKCTHQESRICDIHSHVLILCTEHETLKRVSDYAQIIKPSPFAWLVGETGYKRWQTSKIKTTLVQFMLETPWRCTILFLCSQLLWHLDSSARSNDRNAMDVPEPSGPQEQSLFISKESDRLHNHSTLSTVICSINNPHWELVKWRIHCKKQDFGQYKLANRWLLYYRVDSSEEGLVPVV